MQATGGAACVSIRSSQDAARLGGKRHGVFGDGLDRHTEWAKKVFGNVGVSGGLEESPARQERPIRRERVIPTHSALRRGWFFGFQQFRDYAIQTRREEAGGNALNGKRMATRERT